MNLRSMIQDLARDFDAQDEASADLWTWLPSYESVVKRHGDYACEYGPPIAEVMAEAAWLFAVLRVPEYSRYDFECRCGECPIPSVDDLQAFVAKCHRPESLHSSGG